MASHSTTTSNASGLLLRFKLANDGHDTRGCRPTLGQKNIQRTLRYAELAPTKFKSLFRD